MATPPPINGNQFFVTNSLATLAAVDTSKPGSGMTDGALIFVVTEKTLYEFSKLSTLPAGPGVVVPAGGPGRFIRGALTAVIFDGGDPSENLRSNRKDLQSAIDNTKTGIVNLSSEDPAQPPAAGVLSDYGTIGGGTNNEILEDAEFCTISGGFNNTIGAGADFAAIGGGAANQVTGENGFAAGLANLVSGDGGTAFGSGCAASGSDSFAAGQGSVASGFGSAAMNSSEAFGDSSFAANFGQTNGAVSAAFNDSFADGDLSFAEGTGVASGTASHAEGEGTLASGLDSHAEGFGTTASGDQSHAEGSGNTASGPQTHAEGLGNTVSGDAAHVEGQSNIAGANISHLEGSNNISVAGDFVTTAGGIISHVEGVQGNARFPISHVHGLTIITVTNAQTQNTDVGLFGISAAGAPVDLGVVGFPSTLFNNTEIHLENNKVYKFKCELVAHNRDAVTDADATKWAEWDFSFLAFMVGGVATVTGAPLAAPPDNESPGGSGWTITVTAVGDIVRFTFTGAAADATVQALAYAHFLELGNPTFF